MSLFGGGSQTSTTTMDFGGRHPAMMQGFDLWRALWEPIFAQQGFQLTSRPREEFLREQLEKGLLSPELFKKSMRQIKEGRTPNETFELSQRELTDEEKLRKQLEDQVYDQSLRALESGASGGINPEVRALLDQIYAEREREGTEALRRFGVEMAGSRGLNLSDTPVAAPLLREMANLQSQLGASKAQDILGQNAATLQRAQALREFQQNLQQQKLSNLFASSGAAGQMATQLYGIRRGNPKRVKQTVSGGGGGLFSGLGALAGGLGMLATPFMPSAAASMPGLVQTTPPFVPGSPAWNIPAMAGRFGL